MSKESKPCLVCKRPFTNRKSWKLRNQWEQVVYCSDRCKRAREGRARAVKAV